MVFKISSLYRNYGFEKFKFEWVLYKKYYPNNYFLLDLQQVHSQRYSKQMDNITNQFEKRIIDKSLKILYACQN